MWVLVNGEAVGVHQPYPSYASFWMKRLWILKDLLVIPKSKEASLRGLL
jgi:hypothetical protein